jgi:Fe-S-cluster-containing hydrogenase component 2
MEDPVCVDVCPTKALELVDLEEIENLLRERRKAVTRRVMARDRRGLYVLTLQ